MNPDTGDINLAKTQVSRDDDLDDELREKFVQENGKWYWTGTDDELRRIRRSMTAYRKSDESAEYERRSFKEANRLLQYIDGK